MNKHRETLPALTGLRFFAAAAIVLHHVKGQFGVSYDFLPGVDLASGVSFFFVLSGFILTVAYNGMGQEGWKRFYLARFARIWPLHFTCVILLYLFIGSPLRMGHPDTLPMGLLNLLLLHAWVPDVNYFFGYNAVSWSISDEAFFYAVFPFILLTFRKNGATWIIGSFAIVLSMVALCSALDLPEFHPNTSGPSISGLIYINPATRIFEFIVGITTAMLWLRSRDWLDAKVGILQPIALSLSIAAWGFTVAAGNVDLWSPAMAEWIRKVGLTCPASAFLIYSFATRRGALGSILSTRIFVWLGEISYAMYLVHQIPLNSYILDGSPYNNSYPFIGLAAYLLTVLVLSAALHHLVEEPVRRLLTGRTRVAHARRPAPDTALESRHFG